MIEKATASSNLFHKINNYSKVLSSQKLFKITSNSVKFWNKVQKDVIISREVGCFHMNEHKSHQKILQIHWFHKRVDRYPLKDFKTFSGIFGKQQKNFDDRTFNHWLFQCES